MPNAVPLKVQLVAKTEFFPPSDIPWETDADGGEALAEFAGRACYQSWSKPNPRTATNAGYLRHLLEVGHLSVLEHGSVSFYISGISRSCTHELIRHRHFSYSQLSQRFVRENDANVVIPPAIAGDARLEALFAKATEASRGAYAELLEALEEKLADEPNGPVRNKQARQAARSVLPNATETRVVVTGNYRPGDISSRCGPPSTPTSRSGTSRSSACGNCRWRRRMCSATSKSSHCPTVPRWRRASSQRSSELSGRPRCRRVQVCERDRVAF